MGDFRRSLEELTRNKDMHPSGWHLLLRAFLTFFLASSAALGIYYFSPPFTAWGQEAGISAKEAGQINRQLDKPVSSEPFNILILGTDGRAEIGGPSRSDTIMVAHVVPDSGEITLLSIPRDLYVRIPNARDPYQKINAAFAIGGVPATIATVKELTGLPIHHYAVVDFKGFEKIVDALGGVEIDVDKRYYEKTKSGINLQPGPRTLNGSQALAYVRFRHDEQGDFGRISRQQAFLKALKNKLLSARTFSSIPELAGIAKKYIQTDMSTREIVPVAEALYKSRSDVTIHNLTLTGIARSLPVAGDVVIPDQARNRSLLAPLTKNTPPLKQVKPEVRPPENPASIEVNVVDATGGKAGAAVKVQALISDKGYPSTMAGAAPVQERSVILYPPGYAQAALTLKESLRDRVAVRQDPAIRTDQGLVLVLGANYQSLLPASAERPSAKNP